MSDSVPGRGPALPSPDDEPAANATVRTPGGEERALKAEADVKGVSVDDLKAGNDGQTPPVENQVQRAESEPSEDGQESSEEGAAQESGDGSGA